MEIASKDIDRKGVLAILGEYTEMPLSVKLEHMSRLMYGEESDEERKAEFQKLLSSLPIESVRSKIFKNKLQKLEDALVEQMLTSAKCVKLCKMCKIVKIAQRLWKMFIGVQKV